MKTLLIDAFNIGHIAFHSMGSLDYQGRKTGVVFGFFNKLLSLSKEYDTNRFVFCWDSERRARRLVYKDYKKHRDKAAPITISEEEDRKAFKQQIEDLRQDILPSLGFKNIFRLAGLEGDDVMALAVINNNIEEFVIVSTDRDMYQLLNNNVFIHNPRTNKKFTKDDFEEIYKITPEQWALAKAIGGCNGDGVPGIPGVADPSSSEKSVALKYIRGELKKGNKKRVRIESEEGQKIIKRNLCLVKIPFTDRIKLSIKEDAFVKNDFISVFDKLGFTSFLRQDKLKEWEQCLRMNMEMTGKKKTGF